MPVYSFSTKSKKPADTEAVEKLKKYCDNKGLNFSSVMIKLIKEANDGLEAKV